MPQKRNKNGYMEVSMKSYFVAFTKSFFASRMSEERYDSVGNVPASSSLVRQPFRRYAGAAVNN